MGNRLGALALFAAMALVLATKPAAAQNASGSDCQINTRNSAPMQQVLDNGEIEIDGYRPLCRQLREANLGVDVVDHVELVGDRMIAIIVMRLYDRASSVNGGENATGLIVDTDTGEAARTAALMAAFNNALGTISGDLDHHVTGVNANVGRLRALHANGVPAPMIETRADCRFPYMNSNLMNVAMDAWDWPSFTGHDALCEVLRPEGAGLAMIGGRTATADQGIAWVATAMFDKRTLVEGRAWTFAIRTSDNPSAAEQLALQREAAIASRSNVATNPQDLLRSLNEVRDGNTAWFTGPGQQGA
jgi:hypothetical protein